MIVDNLISTLTYSILFSIRSVLANEITKATDKDIGLVATSIGVSCSFILAAYKYEVGNQLKSLTILAGKIWSDLILLIVWFSIYIVMTACHELSTDYIL